MSTFSNDDVLAGLLESFIAQMRAGERPDVEAAARAHPDLAEELRQLWGAVMVADAVAVHSSTESQQTATQYRATSPDIASRSLPWALDDYELLEELGRGGMGVVYKARQLSLGRIVALKMILRGGLASSADVTRFQAEAEVVARLEHPNIVPLYEVGQFDGQPYFTMKFVGGTTLAKRLAEGPLPARGAAEILAPICRAIHVAHGQGLLHRDLKPSNVLLDETGRPMVTDFGLAKRFTDESSLTHTGAVVGTPSYMAPEQAAGGRGEMGPASDVYSLGTILYQMLTGHPPFQAASPVDTVLMVLEQEPLPPHVVNAKADRDLEMIAMKAIQKPPDLRYDTAEAMAEDLDAYLAGEPVSARSGGFSQVVARLFRETHHAPVLQNWGLLWMWHALVLLLLCVGTNALQWAGVTSRWPYPAVWVGGLLIWAPIFWAIRRRAGPVTFVERQIAHVWGAAVTASVSLFVVEMLLGLPVLSLSPVLGLANGMVFVVKAGILTGSFYFQAAALFITAGLMCLFPAVGLTIFGIVSALCFFIPGMKYYREARSA
jgi:eukaryotic-like serine/threonine-protein kinase